MPTFNWDVKPTIFQYPEWLSFMPGDGIRYYSLLYVGVFLGGFRLLDWQLQRAGASEEDASDFVLYGVIAVLGGARMGHVFFYDFEKFKEDPMWLFRIWEGGLASHGGMIGLIIAMWLFTKLRRQSFLEGGDRFAWSAALGTILIRLGNFMNSEIVGIPTDQSWGVRFVRHDGPDGLLRHPSQLYEAAMGMLIMAALTVTDRVMGKEKRPRGLMLSLFFFLYFAGRFFVEYVKEFQVPLLEGGALTMGQYLSVIPATAGAVGVVVSLQRRIPAKWNVYKPPTDEELDARLAKEDAERNADKDIDDVLLDKS